MMIKNVVITGKLNSMTRSKFIELLKNYNVNVQSKITKSTDYLITNFPNSGTDKNVQASANGIPKISELDFIVLLKEQTIRNGGN